MPTLEAAREASTPAIDPTFSLELTRVIAAPRHRVFDAWTRPEMIRQWLGPANTSCSAETNPVEGGAYTIHMVSGKPHEGQGTGTCNAPTNTTTVRGTYTQVSPYDLLQFTWAADWSEHENSLVTLRFRDVEGGTELRLLHQKFLTVQSRDGHNQGWNASLDKLTTLLAH